MRTNIAQKIYTHEGAPASVIKPVDQLRRSVMACMLWEDTFYEEGQAIADRIVDLVGQVSTEEAVQIALEAKEKLRHVPLLIIAALIKHRRKGVPVDLVIRRADELAEFVSITAKLLNVPVKRAMTAQVKRGIAKAFTKFDAYQLAKYNRDTPIKLRDVLFLSHAKPKDEEQAALWKKLVDGTLESPDTWEVSLSGGADKKETFTRLIQEGKLGYLALLRNLRKMNEVGVDEDIVKKAILEGNAKKILPFRFIAAARHAVNYEPVLDQKLLSVIEELPLLKGKTAVLVDVSVSMGDKLSQKSDMNRMDAAAALASIIRAESLDVYSFSNNVVAVPARKGMAGVEAILKSQPYSGTELGGAIHSVSARKQYDRMIVITDEQSRDRVNKPNIEHLYMINVANYQNGVGYGDWLKIDGFSENVIRWIYEYENRS